MSFNSIEEYIRNLEFKKTAFGGVDQTDVLYKIRELIELFQREAEEMKERSSAADEDMLKGFEEKLAGTEKELSEAKAKVEQSDKRLAEAAAWIHEASRKMAKYQAKLAEYEAAMTESAEKLSSYAGRLADAENRIAEYEKDAASKGRIDLGSFEEKWNAELDAIREECGRRIAEIEAEYEENLSKAQKPKMIRITADSVKVNVMPKDVSELS